MLRDSIGRSSQSAQEREWLIQETIVLFEQGAPWGLGPGSTKPLLQTQLAPYAYQTHDDYIESIVERGVIGAFGLLVLIGSLGVRTWAVATKPLAPAFAELFPRMAPLVGALLGLAVSASYYQILHFRHVWAFFAVIAALYLWGRRSPEPGVVLDVNRLIQLVRKLRHPFTENVVALGGSMITLGIATLWVARIGGPVAVGDYALLRILPWLLAVIVSGGLAAAIAYFLAGPTRDDPQRALDSDRHRGRQRDRGRAVVADRNAVVPLGLFQRPLHRPGCPSRPQSRD